MPWCSFIFCVAIYFPILSRTQKQIELWCMEHFKTQSRPIVTLSPHKLFLFSVCLFFTITILVF